MSPLTPSNFESCAGAVSLHAVPAMIAWAAGCIAVSNLDSTYMGKWSGLSYVNSQQRTLPYGLELDKVFQHNEVGLEIDAVACCVVSSWSPSAPPPLDFYSVISTSVFLRETQGPSP